MTNHYEQFSGERYSRYTAECARMASFAHNPDALTLHTKPQDDASEIEAIRLDSGKQNPREAVCFSRAQTIRHGGDYYFANTLFTAPFYIPNASNRT
jgi:hypothetical protein